MALKKISNKSIFGTSLVQHYGADFSDVTTSSSSWTTWDTTTFTPHQIDSHLEIVFTGSVFTSTTMIESNRYGNIALNCDGTIEYYMNGILGGRQTLSGERYFYNPRFSQHNVRQQWNMTNFGTGLYLNHIYAPGHNNLIDISIQVNSDNGHLSLEFKDGYITITELDGSAFTTA
jgi:hypothetical protein